MLPVNTVGYPSTLSLSWAGGDNGMGVGRHSPLVGSNPCPFPKSGYLRKELLREDRDRSDVPC